MTGKRWQKVGKNVSAQDGWLYLNLTHQGTRYSGAFNLRDTDDNRDRALSVAEKIRLEIKLDEFDPTRYAMFDHVRNTPTESAYPTLEQYADVWLDRKKQRLAASTFRDYRNLVLRYLVPEIGDRHLDEIDREVLERWLKDLDAKISRTYARDCLKRARAILREAEEEYQLDTGIRFVKPYRIDRPADPKIDAFFTLEELSRMYFVAGPRMRAMLLTSAFAGLRTGEVIALRREDVDFEFGNLNVRAGMSEGQRRRVKTTNGHRRIRMHPVLSRHLHELLISHNHNFVFVSQRGNPYRCRQSFTREYNRVKELAGVRDLRWYALRKLFATLRYACTDAAAPEIAREMGHKKPSLSLDTYAGAMPHLGCRFEEIDFPVPPEKLPRNSR